MLREKLMGMGTNLDAQRGGVRESLVSAVGRSMAKGCWHNHQLAVDWEHSGREGIPAKALRQEGAWCI